MGGGIADPWRPRRRQGVRARGWQHRRHDNSAGRRGEYYLVYLGKSQPTEWNVELPLALPVILAGLRTATVWSVGMATLSTPVGAQSLGNYIFSGLQTRNFDAVLVGC